MGKSKDNKNKVYLEFIGNNANGVTGSCIYGKFYDPYLERDFQFLLECGIKQDGSILDNYMANTKMLDKIDVKNIDVLFQLDNHADHSLLVPALTKRGFDGTIFVVDEKRFILKRLWTDCEHINKDEVKMLISKGVKAKPYYELKDIEKTMGKLEVMELEQEYHITPNIFFTFIPNRHNLGSCSIVLNFRDKNNNVHRLYYSSDLGNVKFDKYFINQKQEPISNANVCIYESTYSARDRLIINKALRKKEIYELKQMLRYTLLEKKGSVLLPAFSFDRTPNLLVVLKEILDEDEELRNIKVVCTGKLTNDLLTDYGLICKGKDKEKIDEILQWKNLIRVDNYKSIPSVYNPHEPKIILASSGFCTNGYVVYFLEHMLSHSENTIIFSGYSSPDSPATKIKQKEEWIKLGESRVKMNCDVMEMHSFSSHIMRDDLIEFITNTNMDKCILVHGEKRDELAEDLREEFAKRNKSTKVLVPMIGQSLLF